VHPVVVEDSAANDDCAAHRPGPLIERYGTRPRRRPLIDFRTNIRTEEALVTNRTLLMTTAEAVGWSAVTRRLFVCAHGALGVRSARHLFRHCA